MGYQGIALYSHDRQLIWAWNTRETFRLEVGEYQFCYAFSMLPIRAGAYYWQVSLYDETELLDIWDCVPEMIVTTENHQHSRDEWQGVLNMPTQFKINPRR